VSRPADRRHASPPATTNRQQKLELAIGRKGIALSREKSRLLCSVLGEVRAFVASGRKVLVTTEHGTARTTTVGGMLVLELINNGPGRPLRMTREKTRLVLACEKDIRSFARAR
jgi:hypothetical protein